MLDVGAVTPRPPTINSQGPISGRTKGNSTVHDDHLIQAKIKLAGKESNPLPPEIPESKSVPESPSKKRKSGKFKHVPIADLDSDISSNEDE